MKKERSKQNREKLDRLVLELESAENKVPNKMKTVFNFKGRKSPHIAKKAMSVLTDPGETIFEPFMGSASFVLAAVMAGRKIIATELDNYTYDVVKTLFTKIDAAKLDRMFERLKRLVKAEVMKLYETSCCNVPNHISKLLYDPRTKEYFHPTPNREIMEGKNIKLSMRCPVCGCRQKAFDDGDEQKRRETEAADTSRFPQDHYMENSRINITTSTGADRYDSIFTKRNQQALLLIQDGILKLARSPERDVLEHALVSSLSLARIAMYGSSTDILYHVVPYGAQEMNVWELFEGKHKAFLTYKKEYACVQAEDVGNNPNYQLYPGSYQEYVETQAQPGSFALVYTDFPYTDQVPYLERSQMYRIWLNTFYRKNRFVLTPKMLKQEMVQTNAPQRKEKQSLQTYYRDLDGMFAACYKVLKQNGLAVFTMKLGKSKYFTTLIEIINLARKNGFEYALRIGLHKNDPSLRKQSAYDNTLSNEMMVVFEKLEESNRYWYIGTKNYEFETVRLIYQHLLSCPEEVTLSTAVRYVKENLRKQQAYFARETELERIRQVVVSNFLVDPKNACVTIDSNRLYLDIEDKTDLFTKFYDYIPVIIRRLLEEKGSFVLDDLYFELANQMCTGDPETVNQFLDNPSHQKDIERLLHSYCETDGKEYRNKAPDTAVSERAVDISTLEGSEFERVIKRLLEAEGYTDVINTGGSGDLGVDLLAKKADYDGQKQTITLFQCKRWVSDVGSEPFQRLDSERARRHVDKAVCITTSGYTPHGKKISREREIAAIDGEEVIRRLNLYFPGQYYHGMLDAKRKAEPANK